MKSGRGKRKWISFEAAKGQGFPFSGKPGKAGFSFGREDAVKTGRFLVFFIFAYMVLSLAGQLVGIENVELWVAGNVLGTLQLFGFTGTVSLEETAVISLANGPSIEISELCTGLTETFLIVGAIIASFGISLRRRVLGAVAAGIATIALNHARIVATALIIIGSGDLALIEFAHNILFRVFLFATVAGIYIAWFYWAASREAGAAIPEKKPSKH